MSTSNSEAIVQIQMLFFHLVGEQSISEYYQHGPVSPPNQSLKQNKNGQEV